MTHWRNQHPQANLTEIEHEVEARLAGLRSQMIKEAANPPQAAEFSPPPCPGCGTQMSCFRSLDRRGLVMIRGKDCSFLQSFICHLLGDLPAKECGIASLFVPELVMRSCFN